MGAINPTVELAQVTSKIDSLQQEIAVTEDAMNLLISGETVFSEEGGELDGEERHALVAELRAYMTSLKGVLGACRSEEAFWKQELNDEKAARRNQNELGKV